MNHSYQLVLVGGQLLPIFLGIKEFPGDKILLVTSKETQSKTQQLKNVVKGRSFKETVCDPYDFNSVYNCLNKLVSTFSEKDLVKINLTGGTKIMLLAAQRVIAEKGFAGFYINQNHSYIEVPSFQIRNLTTSLSIVEYFQLSGHQVSKYNTLKSFDANDVKAANSLFDFSLSHRNVYNQLSAYLYKLNKENVVAGPSGTHQVTSSITLSWTPTNVKVSAQGKEVWNKSSQRIIPLVFNTGWWELCVARQLEGWSHSKEMFLQVELPFKADSTLTKNEIDILVNLGSKLLFIECKSGQVRNEDINKMKVIRDTYGGAIAKSVLVTRYSPPQNIVEKCNELGIDIFDIYLGNIKKNDLSKLPDFLDKSAKKLSI